MPAARRCRSARSDFETATPRPYMKPSATSAANGGWVQPSPGGTTSPWAFSAIVGPFAEAPAHHDVRAGDHPDRAHVLLRHRVALDVEAQVLRADSATTSAIGAQSPGGLEEGVCTSRARNASRDRRARVDVGENGSAKLGRQGHGASGVSDGRADRARPCSHRYKRHRRSLVSDDGRWCRARRRRGLPGSRSQKGRSSATSRS